MRIMASFEKGADVRYLSHLDLQRTMQRALRRAGLPVRYSVGFNPHVLLSFGSALPVGVRSTGEVLDVAMIEDIDAGDFVARMNAALPPALRMLEARTIGDDHPAPMGMVASAWYDCTLPADVFEKIAPKLDAFMAQDKIEVRKRTKSGERTIDVHPMIFSCQTYSNMVRLHLSQIEQASVRPELVLDALARFAGVDDTCVDICRTQLCDASGVNILMAKGRNA